MSGVRWLDEHGVTVELRFEDGTVRVGPGGVPLRGEGAGRLRTTDGPVRWLPRTWDVRADEAWQVYVAGDVDAALAVVDAAAQDRAPGAAAAVRRAAAGGPGQPHA